MLTADQKKNTFDANLDLLVKLIKNFWNFGENVKHASLFAIQTIYVSSYWAAFMKKMGFRKQIITKRSHEMFDLVKFTLGHLHCLSAEKKNQMSFCPFFGLHKMFVLVACIRDERGNHASLNSCIPPDFLFLLIDPTSRLKTGK